MFVSVGWLTYTLAVGNRQWNLMLNSTYTFSPLCIFGGIVILWRYDTNLIVIHLKRHGAGLPLQECLERKWCNFRSQIWADCIHVNIWKIAWNCPICLQFWKVCTRPCCVHGKNAQFSWAPGTANLFLSFSYLFFFGWKKNPIVLGGMRVCWVGLPATNCIRLFNPNI